MLSYTFSLTFYTTSQHITHHTSCGGGGGRVVESWSAVRKDLSSNLGWGREQFNDLNLVKADFTDLPQDPPTCHKNTPANTNTPVPNETALACIQCGRWVLVPKW